MAGLVTLRDPRGVWQPPVAELLDEVRWAAWIAKGRAQDRRGSALRLKAAKLVALAALLVVAALWSNATPFDIVLRFIVAATAIVRASFTAIVRVASPRKSAVALLLTSSAVKRTSPLGTVTSKT